RRLGRLAGDQRHRGRSAGRGRAAAAPGDPRRRRFRGLLRGILQRDPVAAVSRPGGQTGLPPALVAVLPTGQPKFAEATAAVAAPGATVWVQDYQLQLVPALLRSLRPDLTI